jgi:hypothetical protein
MATWPIILPVPSVQGYQGEVSPNVDRTDFDAGEARQRLRYGTAPEQHTVTWKFTPTEMATFVAFHRDEINQGTDYFLMDMHLGEGLQSCNVRFMNGKYQKQPLSGLNWIVSAKLDVKPV